MSLPVRASIREEAGFEELEKKHLLQGRQDRAEFTGHIKDERVILALGMLRQEAPEFLIKLGLYTKQDCNSENKRQKDRHRTKPWLCREERKQREGQQKGDQ